jgi:hypothetical protein
MSKYMRFLLPLGFVASFAFGFTSCDEADTAFDCHNICDDYKRCYDSNFDVGSCRSECREEADRSANFEARADGCASCVNNQDSCASKTFNCTTQCAGILARSTN